jgi:hypothetical protein
MSLRAGYRQQPPKAVEDLLYDYLAEEVPEASENQLRAAARILNESGYRGLGHEPTYALRLAEETAATLREIFAS